jgi:hypothetical protein
VADSLPFEDKPCRRDIVRCPAMPHIERESGSGAVCYRTWQTFAAPSLSSEAQARGSSPGSPTIVSIAADVTPLILDRLANPPVDAVAGFTYLADKPTPTPTSTPVPGALIAYSGADGNTWTIEPDGTDKRKVTTSGSSQVPPVGPHWSRDGRFLAYASVRASDGIVSSLWHSTDVR